MVALESGIFGGWEMHRFLDGTTLGVMGSAFVAALLCVLPMTAHLFPLWIVSNGLHIADTLFHEMGHASFAWLFGRPAVPMIFTLFGADQAGGMSMEWPRSWVVQIAAYAGLAWGCWKARENMPRLFVPLMVLSLLVFLLSFTEYTPLIGSYMGHGGAILMGGFFLFRAWVYLDARGPFERWLNAFFGFFLTLFNFHFAWNLAFDTEFGAHYNQHVAFGITHNDFVKVAEIVPGWSQWGVAIFTIFLAVATMLGALALAIRLEENFYEI